MNGRVANALAFAVAAALCAGAARAQEDRHEHMGMQMSEELKPEFPEMRRAQKQARRELLTLEQALSAARESNPTLRQAEAELRSAKARQRQAGLYPNPSIGYTGDEIRGGTAGGGKQGFFVEQRIVTAGKLGATKAAFGKDVELATTEAEEQRTRVETAVRLAFLRVLAAQEMLETRRGLANIAQEAETTQHRLANTGQADETEVLAAEIEAERMRIAARMQENTLREEWRALAAVLGRPELPLQVVSGDLETEWVDLKEEDTIETLVKNSPAARIADTAAARAQVELARSKKEAFPDVVLRGGLEYNNEQLGAPPHATGWEGIAEASVEIPLFNRNQGNVAAAGAQLDRAQQEKRRISLALRERASIVMDEYANARLTVREYKAELLPRARKAYSLMFDRYGQMLASYPRVLEAQRRLFELHMEYIAALESLWTSGITLQGFLLTDGLEAPAKPGDVDRPVRETNVPTPERTLMPRMNFRPN
ncbi:MAG TPA: TolC family protein [Candidatus Acidoferrum sp.]|nr:TolC family protein [Candidatus Acidoferrum sp.]